jgi:hypothetical protein
MLLLALGSQAAPEPESAPADALSGWPGIRYEPLVAEPALALEALLTLPDGAGLLPELAADGYQTAVIRAGGGPGRDLGAGEVDAQPGARARLVGDLRWLAGAAWLAGPGRPALEWLGLAGELRSPEQLAATARGWLLRRTASPAPFFLLVDLRRPQPLDAAGSEREEEAAAALLDHLDQLGLAGRTVVVLARTGGSRERPLRVLVRPPPGWPGGAGGAAPVRPVRASELAATLRQIGRGAEPVAFPGVVRARPVRPAHPTPRLELAARGPSA